jgi:hypothetical protein
MHLHSDDSVAWRSAVLVLACLLAGTSVWADAPILDDGTIEVHSRNRLFVARPGPKEKSTRVYRELLGAPPEFLWQMPGWENNSYLSNDGEYLVVGYRGGSLLPFEGGPDEVMLKFVKTGHLLGQVRLGDLVRDPGKMRKSVSHKFWGNYAGFISPTLFAVDTFEVRRLVFDVTTGKRVADQPSEDPEVKRRAVPQIPPTPPSGRDKAPPPDRRRAANLNP